MSCGKVASETILSCIQTLSGNLRVTEVKEEESASREENWGFQEYNPDPLLTGPHQAQITETQLFPGSEPYSSCAGCVFADFSFRVLLCKWD